MKAGQIIFIALIVGGIILWNLLGSAKQLEAERKARVEEFNRKMREEDEKRMAARNERMIKYRKEYDEYLKNHENKIYPGNIRPFSFEKWREVRNKY